MDRNINTSIHLPCRPHPERPRRLAGLPDTQARG
jgi:hypothetical protein